MDDYIIFCSIFICTFVIVCILYDCIMQSRLDRRIRETWVFINNMNDFVEAKTDLPQRKPF